MIRCIQSALIWLYESLTRNEAPCSADLIFVFAGKMERKQYGLELYQAGFAPRLLLSVDRFEVSKMARLPLDFVPELVAYRNRTAPGDRHFFCEVDASGTRIRKADLLKWNTYGEALGLREYLAARPAACVLVVSTDIHLQRIATTFGHMFHDSGIEFHYCPVPASYSCVVRPAWWSRADDRKYVMSETVKLLAYRAVAVLPPNMALRFMRLKT
jgi:uncharacterized SAM-binding protein YcdF (DUF218 family)